MANDRDMRVLPAGDAAYARGAELIRQGALVAFPTETVYGLGADATNDTSVAGIFAAKGRPDFNPLIVHVPSLQQAQQLVTFSPLAIKLAEQFWPGALTLVLPRAADSPISQLATAGLDTIAIRVPAGPVAQAFLKTANKPIAAPSANKSGKVSPTTAAHVADDLGAAVGLVIDGGACPLGVESTIVSVMGDDVLLLRPGGVPVEDIEAATGRTIQMDSIDSAKPQAPGQLASHYAPSIPVRLNANDVAADEVLLAFGPPLSGAKVTYNLSEAGDMTQAAANLFAMLRALDKPDYKAIAVMPIPMHGLGRAINDRLSRAAAPRPGEAHD